MSFLSVFVAAIASMIVGAVWYGPLFGRQWVDLMGFSKKEIQKLEGSKKGYFLGFAGALIMAYVLSMFVSGSVNAAVERAFWLWLGFVVPLELGRISWGGKTWNLFFLNAAFWLIALSVMASVIVYMA